MNSHPHHYHTKKNNEKTLISKKDIKLPTLHKNPFVKHQKFFKTIDMDIKKRKKENPFEWNVIVPMLDKLAPKKNVLWVIDDKNKFLPSVTMTPVRSNITYFIAILVWLPFIFYTYKHDNLSLKVTILILVLELVTFFVYSILSMLLFTPVLGQNGKIWLTKTLKGPEYIVIKNSKQINLGNATLLWDYDKLKQMAKEKDIEFASLIDFENATNNTDRRARVGESRMFRSRQLHIGLPYYIVTMLVTLGLICVRMGKKVFYTVLPLIIYICIVTIPPLLLWHWNFTTTSQIVHDRDIKNRVVINGTFMSIAVCMFVLLWEMGTEKILI